MENNDIEKKVLFQYKGKYYHTKEEAEEFKFKEEILEPNLKLIFEGVFSSEIEAELKHNFRFRINGYHSLCNFLLNHLSKFRQIIKVMEQYEIDRQNKE